MTGNQRSVDLLNAMQIKVFEIHKKNPTSSETNMVHFNSKKETEKELDNKNVLISNVSVNKKDKYILEKQMRKELDKNYNENDLKNKNNIKNNIDQLKNTQNNNEENNSKINIPIINEINKNKRKILKQLIKIKMILS